MVYPRLAARTSLLASHDTGASLVRLGHGHRARSVVASVAMALLAISPMFLSGCSIEEPTQGDHLIRECGPESSRDVDCPGANHIHHVDGRFNTTVFQYFGTPGYSSGAGNCILYQEGITNVRNGFFQATWTPVNELHREFMLEVTDYLGNHDNKSFEAVGPSPLRLEFANLSVTHVLHMSIRTPSKPGLIANQEIALNWMLDYEGVENATFVTGGCG
jgi:hypothetical protein